MADKLINFNDNRGGFEVPVEAINNGNDTFSLSMNDNKKDYANKQGMNTTVGESIVGERTDWVNVMFEYNVSNKDVIQASSGTGALTHSNAKAILETGTGVGKFTLSSLDPVRYITGHEVSVDFTCVYGTAEAGVTQKLGIGDDVDGFAGFGYDGTVFGVWLQTIDDGIIHIPQSAWNGDKLDGAGTSGVTIDPEKYNIYKVTYGWYGALPINFVVFTESIGYVVVHTYSRVNTSTNPHLPNPSLPISGIVERASGTGANIQMQTSSWRGGIVGKITEGTQQGRRFLIKTTSTVTGSNNPILSLKSKAIFQGMTNHVRSRIGTATIATDGTKDVEFDVYVGGVLTGGTFVDYDTDNSVMQFNITATSYTPPSGNPVGGTVLAKVDRIRINLIKGDVTLPIYAGSEVHIVATTPSGSNDIVLYFRHLEEF